MNFAFAGAPDFAAWTLEDLVALGRRPSLVISQPDRPVGRGRHAAAPAAAATATGLGIDLLQTEDINAPEVLARLRSAGAKVLVVAAFGQLLRAELLEALPCLNVHGSLLPAYRGAAPIERSIAAGDACTGVSIMRMERGLDTGPWALQTSLSVNLWDDAGSVGRSLAFLGARGLDQVMTGLADGTAVWTDQEGPASYADKLTPADASLDLARSARSVHDQVRSLSPRVGARATSGGLGFKVWRTWPYGHEGLREAPSEAAGVAGHPGGICFTKTRVFAGCAEGVVEFFNIQPDGKAVMTAAEFLRGYASRLGDTIEPPAAPPARRPE